MGLGLAVLGGLVGPARAWECSTEDCPGGCEVEEVDIAFNSSATW